MNYFDFKRRDIFSGPHSLGLLLIATGVFALLSPMFFKAEVSIGSVVGVGVGTTIFGLAILFSYSGTLIDFTKNKVKEYSSIAGYRFGEWTVLPTIATVQVVSSSYVSSNTPNGVSPTLSGKVTDFKIVVCSDAADPALSFVYADKKKAIKHARVLASNLNANLVLHTSQDS